MPIFARLSCHAGAAPSAGEIQACCYCARSVAIVAGSLRTFQFITQGYSCNALECCRSALARWCILALSGFTHMCGQEEIGNFKSELALVILHTAWSRLRSTQRPLKRPFSRSVMCRATCLHPLGSLLQPLPTQSGSFWRVQPGNRPCEDFQHEVCVAHTRWAAPARIVFQNLCAACTDDVLSAEGCPCQPSWIECHGRHVCLVKKLPDSALFMGVPAVGTQGLALQVCGAQRCYIAPSRS